MTSVTLEPTLGATANAADLGANSARRLALVLGLITAAHLPLLLIHAVGLWQDPQYQFFPIVLVGAAAFRDG